MQDTDNPTKNFIVNTKLQTFPNSWNMNQHYIVIVGKALWAIWGKFVQTSLKYISIAIFELSLILLHLNSIKNSINTYDGSG